MGTATPNVVLVVMDTARADAFEPYGAPAGSTPAMADMARSGRAYQAFASACWTVPSHASLFSGLQYRAAGFGNPANSHADYKAAGDRLADRWLPSVLRRHGYRTLGASSNMWVSDWGGWDRGFDEWRQVRGDRTPVGDEPSWRERLRWDCEALTARVDDGARQLEGITARWLQEREGDQPFFWFVNLVECHSPFLPPRPYNPLRPWARLRAGEEALRYLNFFTIWKGLCSRTEAPEPALARMRSLYAAAVRYMDDWVARLLERLDDAGVLDSTIVVVTSDHGENLGENGLLGHGFSLDDRLVRVPLVVLGPATELPTPVASLCDVPGWLADNLGLAGHPYRVGDGRVAVAEFDPPVHSDDPRADETIEKWGLGVEARARLTTPFTCATDGRLKLIRCEGREYVVDLAADRLESGPVPVDADVEARWTTQLATACAALDAAMVREVPGVQAAPAPDRPSDELAEMEAQMKLLGYM